MNACLHHKVSLQSLVPGDIFHFIINATNCDDFQWLVLAPARSEKGAGGLVCLPLFESDIARVAGFQPFGELNVGLVT